MSSDVRNEDDQFQYWWTSTVFNSSCTAGEKSLALHAWRAAIEYDRTRPPEAARSPDAQDLADSLRCYGDGYLLNSEDRVLIHRAANMLARVALASPSPDPRGRNYGNEALEKFRAVKTRLAADDFDVDDVSRELLEEVDELAKAALAQPPAAPDEPLTLDSPALVGATLFGHGIKWSTVIACAQRAAAFNGWKGEMFKGAMIDDIIKPPAAPATTGASTPTENDDAKPKTGVASIDLAGIALVATGARAEAVARVMYDAVTDEVDIEWLGDVQVIAGTLLYTAPPEVTHGAAIGGDLFDPARMPERGADGMVRHPDTGLRCLYDGDPDDETPMSTDCLASLGWEIEIERGDYPSDSQGREIDDSDEAYWEAMRAWDPTREGWRLVAIADTEDGPSAWFARRIDRATASTRSDGVDDGRDAT